MQGMTIRFQQQGRQWRSRQANHTDGFEHSRDYVQSLARGLSVLRAFDADHTHLSLAEIAHARQLSRAAARRLVLTLQHLGYVRAVGRDYTLSPRVLELGFGYLGSLKLTDLAQPLIEELAQRIDQSCSMAVLDGQSIVYVLRVPVRRVMTVSLGVGARLPACCGLDGPRAAGGTAGGGSRRPGWPTASRSGTPAHGDRQEEARAG